MKSSLLFVLFLISTTAVSAQAVADLSPGKYESKLRSGQGKWEKGDVIILDKSHYKLSGNSEVGDYRFSVAAQRIFFTSGPLKTAFTKVVMNNNKTVIIFPLEQNAELGLKGEVWASQ